MAMMEQSVQEEATKDVKRYSQRVYLLALIYFVLNIVSLVIMVIVAWRVKYWVALSQRSNVETLTVAILFVLGGYYVISTFNGFIGAIRIFWQNLPGFFSHSQEARMQLDRRKHGALRDGGDSPIYVCLDKAVRLEGKPHDTIKWQVGDHAGKLGDIALDGVRMTFYPCKDGMDASIFSFVTHQLDDAVKRKDPEASVLVTQWSTVDEDGAAGYYSMVAAFCNLEGQLGNKGELWPRYEISEHDVELIQKQIRRLTPVLRDEALLPDLEYAVEYNVPVMPEPLGFVRLTRNQNRADPVATMGCAGLVMVTVMAVLTFFILLPPWLPSK